jgi:phosphoribosylaminoimidazole carboxylase PurE protein
MSATVMVLMGSANDWETMREVGVELGKLGITWEAHVASAHRSLARTVDVVRQAEAAGVRVFVCGAGMAAHLAGVVAAVTIRPVIGVPLPGGIADGLDALLATVQMPAGVPVAAVAVGRAGARNAAVLAAQILAIGDAALAERLAQAKAAQAQAVEEADAALPRGGGWA